MTYLKLAESSAEKAARKTGLTTEAAQRVIWEFLNSVSAECKNYKTANLFDGLSDCLQHGENSDYSDANFTSDADIK